MQHCNYYVSGASGPDLTCSAGSDPVLALCLQGAMPKEAKASRHVKQLAEAVTSQDESKVAALLENVKTSVAEGEKSDAATALAGSQ